MTAYLREIEVNTIEEALTQIRDLLLSELWEVDAGTPASLPFVMKGKANGGIRPWLRYTNPTGTTLTLQGDFDGTGSSLSTARDSVLGSGSKLWLAADDEAICQYIKPTSGSGDAYHAGALDRLSPTDSTAIQVGLLNAIATAATTQDAEQFNGSIKWVGSGGQGIFANIFTGAATSSTALLMPVTNSPLIANYFRMSAGVYRGDVKFAVSGLAGATAGSEFELRNPTTNELEKVYVCSGAGAFEVFSAT